VRPDLDASDVDFHRGTAVERKYPDGMRSPAVRVRQHRGLLLEYKGAVGVAVRVVGQRCHPAAGEVVTHDAVPAVDLGVERSLYTLYSQGGYFAPRIQRVMYSAAG
jgi:hypothetical protein